jgi:octaheme c-type cytochrome (tetrathionate reductase family)
MKEFKYIWFIGVLATLLIVTIPLFFFAMTQSEPVIVAEVPFPTHGTHTDHSALLTGPFETGSDVTRACLTCHENAANEVMQTSHWTWLSEPETAPDQSEPISIGKANLINNFCIGVQSNWTGCTRCHTGYGWQDANFDFTNGDNVDCLSCHDQTGTYVKASAGQVAEDVDLISVAQSVGRPSRQNCGSCHFDGGGGNGVKHGDLDESLIYPPEDVDVHMGRYDFQCVDCHTAENHQIQGRAMSVNIDNTQNQVQCTNCHAAATTHEDERITEHLDTVACQTCHIPAVALRDPTKVSWDWSTAGQDLPEDPHEYLRIKGSFVYESNLIPDYAWYNGYVTRYLLGDEIDPSQPTVMNQPQGDISDPMSLIWPFKIHRGSQVYDTQYNYFLQPQTVGETGYWTTFDWDSALRNGAAASGVAYSGSYGFAPTTMYWNLSHMIAPAENALTCTSCHGENGRFDWMALGYDGDPMVWGGRDEAVEP